jgi:hypothetical protein
MVPERSSLVHSSGSIVPQRGRTEAIAMTPLPQHSFDLFLASLFASASRALQRLGLRSG